MTPNAIKHTPATILRRSNGGEMAGGEWVNNHFVGKKGEQRDLRIKARIPRTTIERQPRHIEI